MTKAMYKKILIQQVHLSSKYRAFYKDNKEEYKALLQKSFGVESSKDLGVDSLVVLVDFLNAKIEEITPINQNKITAKQKELLEKRWLLYASDTSTLALLRWIYKVTKHAYMHIEAIDKEDATKALYILQKSLK